MKQWEPGGGSPPAPFSKQRKVTNIISIVTEKESKITDVNKNLSLAGYEVRIEEEILDAEKVAEMLNSSKKVVERELREGLIKGTKRLGKWFVLKSELIAYIRNGEKQEGGGGSE